MPLRRVIAIALLALAFNNAPAAELDLAANFPRYTERAPAVPVYVMPGERMLHRFFDTSPISPSGRYLALFRLPYEAATPKAGDAGEVVLVDLRTGQSRVVATSRGWETQVGANVQWGPTDAELFFNDVDPQTWQACAVRLDPQTGQSKRFSGTVFMVAPDGKTLASHNLVKSRLAQVGYGVVIPDDRVKKNIGPVADDGIYVTEVASDQTRLLVSLRTIYEQSVPKIELLNPQDYEFYTFQVKWNPQGTRLLTAFQWAPLAGGKRHRAVVTMKADGTDLHTAITGAQWDAGGHHINWCPDGEHVSMNLNVDGRPGLEFIRARHDGSELQTLFAPGSGHPSFHPAGRYVITDAYPGEPVAFRDGTVPLRLIDTKTSTCQNIARVYVSSAKGEYRIDAHPACDPSGRYVVFNGSAGDTRRVYIADVGALLDAPARPDSRHLK